MFEHINVKLDIMTAMQFLKKGEIEVKGYKVGLPGTKAYKAKTPRKVRSFYLLDLL